MGTKRKTLEYIIKEGNLKYNSKFDYLKSIYTNLNTQMTIMCPIHGEFKQKPIDHLRGKHGCPKCFRNFTPLDLVGKQFGLLTVQKYLGKNTYQCVCQCGTIKNITRKALISNIQTCKSKQCRTNLRYQKLNNLNKNYSIIPWSQKELKNITIANTKWERTKRDASARSIYFDITKKEAEEKFKEQQGLCKLSGIRLEINTQNITNITASLDRIDSTKNYTIDNIQWIHKFINKMKTNYDQNLFIDLCCKVSQFQNNKNYILENTEFTEYVPIQNIKTYKGELAEGVWRQIKKKAIRRNINIEVSREYAQDMFLKQKGLCSLSGLPIRLRPYKLSLKPYSFIYTASLDRIDSTLPYIKGNLQWVNKKINIIKSHYPQEIFIDICNRISKTNNTILYL